MMVVVANHVRSEQKPQPGRPGKRILSAVAHAHVIEKDAARSRPMQNHPKEPLQQSFSRVPAQNADSRPPQRAVAEREEFYPTTQALVAAAAAVAATYFYFLIFVQFGYLHGVREVIGPERPNVIRALVAGLALAGIAGSAWAGRYYTEMSSRRLLLGAYLACGVAAGLSPLARQLWLLGVVAVLAGAGTGVATVTLVAALRRVVGGERLGTCLGVGTGVGYALSRLPALFLAGAGTQALCGVVGACLAVLAVQGFELRAPMHKPSGFDYRPLGIGAWTGIFFALVWLDSAFFFILQQTPVLQSGSDRVQHYVTAFVHAITALLAGYALDQRWMGRTTALAAGMLLAACVLIDDTLGHYATGTLLYAAAVSFYSTVFVFYPARSGRPELAALLYAVGGWAGTAIGVGMAQRLHDVPGWFIAVAAVLLAGAFGLRVRIKQQEQRAILSGR